ncbi:TRX domain protein [Gregarina niphandrodes]|uniref:protein disulfide-isomerase n=1 Tax=Gregarina niphandrodes TaxID=110365 RepID=A0A023B6R3_GRENI|nr:TRX domain protein [Gregarina niphandrodes]EZG66688.1 TRX domain protein [Gregarina niphandrodes]|eukprot:XP_011130522.1 TRX domain protein [Gregarina niphandrodes]
MNFGLLVLGIAIYAHEVIDRLKAGQHAGIIFEIGEDASPEGNVLKQVKDEYDDLLRIHTIEGAEANRVSFITPTGDQVFHNGRNSNSDIVQFIMKQFMQYYNPFSATQSGDKPASGDKFTSGDKSTSSDSKSTRTGDKASKDEKASKKEARSKKGKVLALNGSNFHKTVMADDTRGYFVKFYAPWCGHCKAMEDTWKQLARQIDPEAMVIAEVNADAEKQLAAEFGVKGFPTLLMFPPGGNKQPVPYNNERDLRSFVDFAQKFAKHVAKVTELVSDSQFEEECGSDSDGLCLISFLPHIYDSSPKERKRYLSILKKVKTENAELPIKYFWTEASHSMELERYYRLEFGWPATILINGAKKAFATHRGGTKHSDLTDFVNGVARGKYKPEKFPAHAPPRWPTIIPWDGKAHSPNEEL